MLKKMLLVMLVLAMVGISTSAFACWWCPKEIKGSIEQENGATVFDGDVTVKNNGNLKIGDNAALVTGGNDSKASFKAKGYGNLYGNAYTFGATLVYAKETKNRAVAAGITGNISGASLYGERWSWWCPKEIKIQGKGELTTLALKEKETAMAGATTVGEYAYKATANGGNLMGYGVTAGFSAVQVKKHSAVAVSGGFTSAGVTQNYFCGPQ